MEKDAVHALSKDEKTGKSTTITIEAFPQHPNFMEVLMVRYWELNNKYKDLETRMLESEKYKYRADFFSVEMMSLSIRQTKNEERINTLLQRVIDLEEKNKEINCCKCELPESRAIYPSLCIICLKPIIEWKK